ncbi:MAG: hypoxanthine phosphoribosyltransferase [Chloroflexota bacterium]|nr:hypoxanthine phosphoribosyltransferase [Chloroflexota bacterium]
MTVAEASAGEASGVQLPPVISADDISQRVGELGAEISEAYAGREPVLVLVLHGAFIFAADLARALTTGHRVESLALASYDGRESSGEVQVSKDLGYDITGRDVLIVEDIVDTGRTAAAALALLESRGPRSIEVVTLLDKPSRRVMDVSPRWVGFEIENIFVVGYGLDLDGRFRGLPYIADADAMDLKGDA